jgi:phenylalanyl-tRNA synthetase alpha chain
MFWQLEGMVVGKWISIPDFRGIMQEIFSALFQTDVKIRLRPSYFPFTEPSFEMDVSCSPEQPELYKLSKETGRLELWGAGMIHPNVLREAGVDPDIYSGFAFGMWLTRMAAIRHHIRDIRYFTNSDLRFIQSFDQ